METKPCTGSDAGPHRARSVFHLVLMASIALALSLMGRSPGQSLLLANVAPLPAPAVLLALPASPAVSAALRQAAPTPVPAATHAARTGVHSSPVTAPTGAPDPSPAGEGTVLAMGAALTSTLSTAEGSPGSRESIVAYTVQAGDTLLSVARYFDLQRETIVWANHELDVDPDLYIGQVLFILPVDGVYHTVEQGETLPQIAARYNVTVESIVDLRYNKATGSDEPSDLETPGRGLIVPGGVKPFKPHFVRYQTGTIARDALRDTPSPENSFIWPVDGAISQGYWDLHRALDIAGSQDTAVVAAAAGVVAYARWEVSGYGNLVVIDHGNGFVSYYAHLFGFYVDVGQSVVQGEPIGVRGNTGRSTGPHLHFELRHNGVQCNPLDYLPENEMIKSEDVIDSP